MKKTFIILLCALVCWHCARPYEVQKVNEPVQELPSSNTLGPFDVIRITVYGEKSLSGTYQVSSDGNIVFPLVGKIKVEGFTTDKVREIITEKLAKNYIRNPYVSIQTMEQNSKKVTVIGFVKNPSVIKYQDNLNIVQAISIVGGFLPNADTNSIRVVRREKGKKEQFIVKVRDISSGRLPNFLVKPGDIIYVPESIF